MKLNKNWLVILLLLLALILRTYRLDQVPPALYIDELDLAYQARSLVETFKDYRGQLSPFFVRSFNSDRTPIPAYFTALATLVWQTPELQTRMASAILGSVNILLIFFLIRLWTANFWLSLLAGLVFAASPWQIQFSRWAYEGPSLYFFFLLGLICFFSWLKNHKLHPLYLATLFLSLGVYTYRTMSLFVPLTFLGLSLIYWRELFKVRLKHLLLNALLAAIIIVPFLYATTLGAADQPRINQLSITADPAIPVWVQRHREIDSGDLEQATIGKQPVIWSFFFHNKLVSWLDAFANNYLKSFSPEFLFIGGDPNPRHSVGGLGQLLLIDLLPLLFGSFFLIKNLNQKHYRWLLLWLLLSPIPAALTTDGAYHASRLFIFSAPLLVIVALGWWQLIAYLSRPSHRLVGLWPSLLLIPLVGLWLLFFSFYLHRYSVHYPLESARAFGYGFKQAMLKIGELEKNFDHVDMVATKDPPMIYYLYWSNTPPDEVQAYGTNFSKEHYAGDRLDKFKVINFGELPGVTWLDKLQPDTLYLLTPSEVPLDLRAPKNVPANITLHATILYPDKEVAFYLLSTP